MTSVKLINHSSSTADWNYLKVLFITFLFRQAGPEKDLLVVEE